MSVPRKYSATNCTVEFTIYATLLAYEMELTYVVSLHHGNILNYDALCVMHIFTGIN